MINPVENKSIYKELINKKYSKKITSENFRKGVIKHLLSNISFIKKISGYNSNVSFENGFNITIDWFISK